MTEHDYIDDLSPIIRLRVWALGQMVWGAFIAGAALVALGGVLLVIWGVSHLLDERSKQAPSPYGALTVVQTLETV